MEIFFITIISLAIGSFASCLTYRLGNDEKFILTRSKCPKCQIILRAINLIPLFSWIKQKGKCHNCKEKISWRYPILEFVFLISFLAIYFLEHNLIGKRFFLLCLIASILIIISVIDIEKYFIPDSLQIILLVLAIIFVISELGFSSFGANFVAGLAFAGFGYALYLLFLVTSRQAAIGIDDIKLLFSLGLMLGFKNFLSFIFLVGIFGLIFGFSWMKIKKDDTFPFAPSLCLSSFICLFIGREFDFIDIIGSILFLQSF